MRRFLPVLLPFVMLAACDAAPLPAAGPDAAPGTVAASPDVHAWFPPRGVIDTIEVDAIDRLPLRAADLVGPDGGIAHASYVNVAATPGAATGQWEVGHPWDLPVTSSTTLAGAAAPRDVGSAAIYSERRLLATASTADISLPDAVTYRRNWQRYRVRLTFGSSPGETETREIAAPQPPAPPSQ